MHRQRQRPRTRATRIINKPIPFDVGKGATGGRQTRLPTSFSQPNGVLDDLPEPPTALTRSGVGCCHTVQESFGHAGCCGTRIFRARSEIPITLLRAHEGTCNSTGSAGDPRRVASNVRGKLLYVGCPMKVPPVLGHGYREMLPSVRDARRASPSRRWH